MYMHPAHSTAMTAVLQPSLLFHHFLPADHEKGGGNEVPGLFEQPCVEDDQQNAWQKPREDASAQRFLFRCRIHGDAFLSARPRSTPGEAGIQKPDRPQNGQRDSDPIRDKPRAGSDHLSELQILA